VGAGGEVVFLQSSGRFTSNRSASAHCKTKTARFHDNMAVTCPMTGPQQGADAVCQTTFQRRCGPVRTSRCRNGPQRCTKLSDDPMDPSGQISTEMALVRVHVVVVVVAWAASPLIAFHQFVLWGRVTRRKRPANLTRRSRFHQPARRAIREGREIILAERRTSSSTNPSHANLHRKRD